VKERSAAHWDILPGHRAIGKMGATTTNELTSRDTRSALDELDPAKY
jgi:hypothetical protein